jgi:hypothetical protein
MFDKSTHRNQDGWDRMRDMGSKDHKMRCGDKYALRAVSLDFNVKSRRVNRDCIAGEGRFWIVVDDTNTSTSALLGRTLGPAYSGQPTEVELASKG